METFTVVRPEHLNHFGDLFGGCLLKWVDEIAWIAASRDYPGCHFVTVAMQRVEFHQGVGQGAVLRFVAEEGARGRTSLTYRVVVFSEDLQTGDEQSIFSTNITFVRLDTTGSATALPDA